MCSPATAVCIIVALFCVVLFSLLHLAFLSVLKQKGSIRVALREELFEANLGGDALAADSKRYIER